jgi:long-chain acyl-CoA synthetase
MSVKILPFLVSANRDRYPQKVAIVHGDNKITYTDLFNSINKLAGGLVSLGVQQGDRIVILLQNSIEFAISFFAISNVGAMAVPLNVQYKEQELAHYLRESQPKMVITLMSTVPLLRDVISVSRSKECIIIGVPNGKDGSFSYNNLIQNNSSFNESKDLLPNRDVLCQYSSGSTGKPKSIVRTHYNLISEAENFCSTVKMTNNDRILCVVPLFHAHGLGNCLLASIYSGATLFILEDFNRRKVLETILAEQITVFPGVPFMFSILADILLREEITLSSLRLCFSAGAPLSRETFQKFYEKYKVYVRQLFGTTETGSVSINLDKSIPRSTDSIGLPMKNVKVEIFGEKGDVLKADEIGDIGIKSPSMTKGYSGVSNLNSESFRNGYFFPGDMGKKDSNGRLYITGRKTFFLNTGGNKVNPSEIETLLQMHPKVKEAVVVGVKSHYGEDVIKAVIVRNSQCDEREVIEFCKGKIADFKVPRIVEFRKEIPKSPLGKVLKKYLCLAEESC